MDHFVGQVLRGYELREKIGQGGFGAVYRAYQPAVEREAAIKVILPQFASQPAFIRRFEVEAQLAARLEHPHIVPLYDYWRDPEGAYLVMRYLRGGSLRQWLQRQGALNIEETLLLLEQIGSALHLAHRMGVVHRDLKPENILLDEDKNAYLTDFGIARLLDAIDEADEGENGSAYSGSLGYMAPEQAMSRLLDVRNDLYSLGVLAYEMLSGVHPFQSGAPDTWLIRKLTAPLPALSERRLDLPLEVDQVLQRASSQKMEERFESAPQFVAALRVVLHPKELEILPSEMAISEMVRNPYKGLHPFEEADAADFFGRRELVQKLLNRLAVESVRLTASGKLEQDGMDRRDEGEETGSDDLLGGDQLAVGRFLAVVGPSGSGKSSVVKAGLLPALRSGALPGSQRWLIAEMLPSAHLLDDLLSILMAVAAVRIPDMEQIISTHPAGLATLLLCLLPADSELLLFIDQFEELFTGRPSEAERSFFLQALETAGRNPDCRLRLGITLRADFYDRPLAFPGFGELMRLGTEVVLPLRAQDMEQVIRGPAEREGVQLERGLAVEIAADVRDQPGALPLLQYALTELFDRRDGLLLTRAAYHVLGGVMGALSRRAEQLYQELSAEEQAAARMLFPRLVTLGEGSEDTRRRVARPELDAISPQVSRVIDIYGRARLLSFDRDPVTRAPTVEVAHEALLREWQRLRQWLDDDRDGLRVRAHLTQAAQDWEARQRLPDDLYRGTRLGQALEWSDLHADALNPLERDFLQNSQIQARMEEAEREAQRRRELVAAQRLAETEKARAEEQALAAARLRQRGRWLAAALGAALLLLLLAAGLGMVADRQRLAAEANYRQARMLGLASEANTLLLAGVNIEAAPQLSIQSLELGYSPQADAVLQRAMTFQYPQRKFLTGGTLFKLIFSPDGRRLLGASGDGAAYLWDVASGEELRRFENPEGGGAICAAFSPDGRQAAVCDDTALLIYVWDVESGTLLHTLGGHSELIWSLSYSPDSERLVSASYDSTLRIWDLTDGEQALQIDLPTTSSSAVFSPDGRTILAGLDDGTARLWDVSTGEELRQFEGHSESVVVVAFSHDGSLAATGSTDKTARLWDVETGSEVLRLTGHGDAIYDINFSADDRQVLTASLDRMALLWDRQTGVVLRRFIGQEGGLYSAALSPDNAWVATGSTDTSAWLWPSGLMPDDGRLDHTSPVNALAISPDGQRILTSDNGLSLHLWNASGALMKDLSGHEYGASSLTFSPDGGRAASAGVDYSVRLWNLTSGEQVRQFGDAQREVQFWSVRFSPDGRSLLAGADYGAYLWNVDTGEEMWRFRDEATSVYGVAFSPDGRTFAITSYEPDVMLFDAHSGEQLWSRNDLERIYALAFSPDGKSLLAGGDRLWLLDVQDGSSQAELSGFSGGLNTVAFSPDGRQAAAGGESGIVHLWDLSTQAEVRQFSGQPGVVYTLAFTPDGTALWIGGASNTAMRWPLTVEVLIEQMLNHSSLLPGASP